MDSRRAFLQALAGSALFGATGCPELPEPPDQPAVRPDSTGIDVHCHVFNARDLPIVGFVLDVVLEGKPLGQLALGPLVTTIALILDASSWTADQELAAIKRGTVRTFAVRMPPASETALVQQRAYDALRLLQEPNARARDIEAQVNAMLARRGRTAAAAAAPSDSAKARFLRSLGDRTDAVVRPPAAASPAAPADPRGEDARKAAAGIVSRQDDVHGVFRLATLITNRRVELVQRLIGLPMTDAGDIAMLTPALIDYSYWLDGNPDGADCSDPLSAPPDVTPLAKQIEVMSAISAIQGKPDGTRRLYAVHPFVSFCPWRQMAEEEAGMVLADTQFGKVQAAVMEKGFVGVKLYPVMGFRPIGNNGAPDATSYPMRLRCIPQWGRKLDAALERLYDWAVARDVPIMAHCSRSQFPSAAAGNRGAPSRWEDVLKRPRWRTLRLNLAHAGGVGHLIDREPGSDAHLWTPKVISMLSDARYPNLYADIADFDAVLQCRSNGPQPETGGLKAFVDLMRTRAATGARGKLMYGSDWVMLSRANGTEGYFPMMRGCLPTAIGMNEVDRTGFLGLNAARFLGLTMIDGRKTQSRERLEQFRQKSGGDPAFFDRWN